MAAIASLAVAITAQTQGFSRGVNQVKQEVGGLNASLERMKMQLGESSAFGGMTQMLSGAGAVAGIAILARELEKLGKAMQDVADGAYRANLNLGDMVEKTARSLPLFGMIFGGINELRKGAVDVTAAGVNKFAGREIMAPSAETELRRLREDQKVLDAIREDSLKLQNEARSARMTGLQKEVQAITDRYNLEMAKVRDLKSELAKLGDESARAAGMGSLKLMKDAIESLKQSDMQALARKLSGAGKQPAGSTPIGQRPDMGVVLSGTPEAIAAERRGQDQAQADMLIQKQQLEILKRIADLMAAGNRKPARPEPSWVDGRL